MGSGWMFGDRLATRLAEQPTREAADAFVAECHPSWNNEAVACDGELCEGYPRCDVAYVRQQARWWADKGLT